MKPVADSAPELTRPLWVDKISAGGVAEHIVANAEERQALAKRFDLLDLPKFEAHLDVDHANAGKMFAVTGKIVADVVQACVVSLEPVKAHIEDEVDVLFAPPHLLDKGAGNPNVDVADEEMLEPIENGMIDLGELVAQHLAVALDPYPRKPGASLPDFVAGEGGAGEGERRGPLADLIKLGSKTKPKK